MTTLIAPAYTFTYDGATVNIYYANKGEGLPRHSHTYAHAIFCTSGSCVIKKEGKEVVFNKNTKPANLIGGQWHEIEALENNTVFVTVFSEHKQR